MKFFYQFWLKYSVKFSKFKLKAHISYHLCVYQANKIINFMTGPCQRTQEMILGCYKGYNFKQNCFLDYDYTNYKPSNPFLSFIK